MQKFIALLRGINVGKAKRLPMEELRAMLAGLGYADVATLLNSGNAVFAAAGGPAGRHAQAIAAAIDDRFKLEVSVVVKSAQELAAIIAGNPLDRAAADHSRLMVAFVQDVSALSGLQAIESLVVSPELFAVGPGAAYLYCANGILESKAALALLGKVGRAATSRNWATTLKLAELVKRPPMA